MHYLFESIYIGLYTSFIYLIIHFFIQNQLLLPFFIGFFKHIFGYLFSLHTYYCNYGYACQNNKTKITKLNENITSLIIESFGEGILFMILSFLFYKFIKIKIILYFFIGLFLHLLFEYLGIHKYFCKYKCISN